MFLSNLNGHRLIMAMIILVFSFNTVLNSQSKVLGTLEGIVLDGSSDQPLENAIVKIIELDKFDVTDKNGIFELKQIPFGDYNIEISYVGYKTTKVTINIDKEINTGLLVHMFTLPFETSTVVVTGLHSNTKFDDMNEFINVLKGKSFNVNLV